MNYKEKYQLWLDNLQEGDPLREELIEIKDNVMEIRKDSSLIWHSVRQA